MFVVLPLGLSTASYIFTKMLRPLIKKWRGSGIRSIIYLDDGILGSHSKAATARYCLIARADLEDAGFLLNEKKSNLFPSQVGEWLGFTIDTKNFSLAVPEKKITKLKELAASELSNKHTSARRMARVAGQIIAMEPGLGSLARLFSRKMYAFIESCHSWDGRVSASQGALDEIQFWENNPLSSLSFRL